MTARISQLPESARNGSLRPIAVLNLEPRDFSERYGLIFNPDTRGTSVAALLQTRPGRQFMLLRHDDDPGEGIQVLADENGSSEHDLLEFLDVFDLDGNVVTWRLGETSAQPD